MTDNLATLMPIKAKPFNHQVRAFELACHKFGIFDDHIRSRGVALLLEMGCGKSLVSIAIAGCLYQYGKIDRVLVVAPLSILGVWEEEFQKFADFPYSLTILKGTVVFVNRKMEKIIYGIPEFYKISIVAYFCERSLVLPKCTDYSFFHKMIDFFP